MAASPECRVDGEAILDPTRVWFLGASLGGIMGGTFMAYDPVILRGALGVPGGAWSLPPEEDNGTYAGVNSRTAVLRQVIHFLDTGDVVHPCLDGDAPAPCDCATGACE